MPVEQKEEAVAIIITVEEQNVPVEAIISAETIGPTLIERKEMEEILLLTTVGLTERVEILIPKDKPVAKEQTGTTIIITAQLLTQGLQGVNILQHLDRHALTDRQEALTIQHHDRHELTIQIHYQEM